MSQDALDAMVAEMAEEYRAAIAADLQEMAQGGLTMASDRGALREIAHRHAGSAASFGFEALGRTARAAETALKAAPGADDARLVAQWLSAARETAGLG
jgi:HPt (histidine-containing phosphotransfer) domain-containing protein